MRRKKKLFLLISICVFLGCAGCREKETSGMQLEEAEVVETQAKEEVEDSTIFVYVCGAVCEEGVYELEAGSRVYEAIALAGGFAENAEKSAVNQAELLKDEERLYVPSREEVESGQTERDGLSSENGKVNLNTAGKEELMTLSGIGEAKAESIIRYREQQGRFWSIEEIKQIEGIKDGVFEKIKDKITV